jgi:glycerophosphoryl diester phosphodiesterase
MVNSITNRPRPFAVIGHRGATTHKDFSRIQPENTLPAFQSAYEQGAAIELDVMTTRKDAQNKSESAKVVVYHDFETGRIFKLPGQQKPVSQTPWAALKNAFFNPKGHEQSMRRLLGNSQYQSSPKFEDLKVPELETVLDQLPKAKFSIELKTPSLFRRDHLEEKVARIIKERDLYDQVTVLGFSPFSLRKIKQIDPKIRTALNFDMPAIVKHNPFLMKGFVNTYAKGLVGVDALQPSYADTSPKLVQLSHEAGLPIMPWVDKETREEERKSFPVLMDMGVDGLITNSVDLLNEAVVNRKLGLG